jgi:hypothetical protein
MTKATNRIAVTTTAVQAPLNRVGDGRDDPVAGATEDSPPSTNTEACSRVAGLASCPLPESSAIMSPRSRVLGFTAGHARMERRHLRSHRRATRGPGIRSKDDGHSHDEQRGRQHTLLFANARGRGRTKSSRTDLTRSPPLHGRRAGYLTHIPGATASQTPPVHPASSVLCGPRRSTTTSAAAQGPALRRTGSTASLPPTGCTRQNASTRSTEEGNDPRVLRNERRVAPDG